MITDLIGATRDYWRKLDQVEAAYQQGDLSAEAVNVEVQQLMSELGAVRRQALRDFSASLQYFVRQQQDAIAGTAAIALLACLWLINVS